MYEDGKSDDDKFRPNVRMSQLETARDETVLANYLVGAEFRH